MSDIHKMKLLILATCYPRGKKELREGMVYGKFIKDFAKEWARRGHEVYVLTPHSVNTLSYEKLEGVHVHRFHYFFREPWETLTYGDGVPENIRKFKNKLLVPFLAFGFWWHALKLIRKHKIDIVNAHWVPTGYIALWIKAFTNVRLVTTIYGAELFPVIAGRMRILKPFIKKVLGKTDIAVGISRATVNAAKELSGREDILVIPDGIDIDYYKPGPKNVKLLERYNCNGKKIVFYTGRMVERKGHRYLLEAMKYIKREASHVKLILGGKGLLFQELQNLREKFELQNIVEMPGFIPENEVVPLLQSVDIFVLPSCVDKNGDTEGSATAALEAMACGTPAIISEVGGNKDAVIDGEGAFYFQTENAVDLAHKITPLLDDQELMNKNSQKAREFIKEHYSWEMIVQEYLNLLDI
jgi:glycosyltransferase involved in cell wall biosynthesis